MPENLRENMQTYLQSVKHLKMKRNSHIIDGQEEWLEPGKLLPALANPKILNTNLRP